MPLLSTPTSGAQLLDEMKEFATLPPAAQRYIKRSLEVRFDGAGQSERFARDAQELHSIDIQSALYESIKAVKGAIPADDQDASVIHLTKQILPIAGFDLAQGKIQSFAAFRFLYERVIGPAIRPWLLTIFTYCVTRPQVPPAIRMRLLTSIDRECVARSNWSPRQAQFFPQWVETLDD